MQVTFRSNHLRECFEDETLAYRTWGRAVGARYLRRVDTLRFAPSVQFLQTLQSLRFHALRGGRRGEYALDLIGRWRLIVTMEGDIVTVEEVSNHYGD